MHQHSVYANPQLRSRRGSEMASESIFDRRVMDCGLDVGDNNVMGHLSEKEHVMWICWRL